MEPPSLFCSSVLLQGDWSGGLEGTSRSCSSQAVDAEEGEDEGEEGQAPQEEATHLMSHTHSLGRIWGQEGVVRSSSVLLG